MKVDFICYKRMHILGIWDWVCHIQETDGLQRSWSAERHVTNPFYSEQAKEEAVDEAYAMFHKDLIVENEV